MHFKSRKSIVAITLLIILVLNATGASMLLVHADAGGTGKYLTVFFDVPPGAPLKGFEVTATKVQSGHVWTYKDSGDSWKLGAGDVSLQAYCPSNYILKSWTFKGDSNTIVEEENPTVFKSEKYAEVIATFVLIGYYLHLDDPEHGSVNVDPPKPYYYPGESATLTFDPDDTYHLSSVKDNDAYADLVETVFTNSYTITFNEDHWVTVKFDRIGTAEVPPGDDVTVFLSNSGSLTFTDPGTGGMAFGSALSFPVGTSVVFWEINTNVEFFESNYVVITLRFEGDSPEVMYTADSPDQLYSDVNGDGDITHDDMVEVAVAISTSGREYIPKYDVNRDGFLDQQDINTVKKYIGTSPTLIPYIDFNSEEQPFPSPPSSEIPAQWTCDGYLIFIQTSHFSIFRGR